MNPFADFDGGEPIHRITCADLIADGQLVDVSRLHAGDVRALGIAYHVAMSAAAYAAAVWPIDDEPATDALVALGESYAARVRRVLAAYAHTVRRQAARGGNTLRLAVAVRYAADDVRELELKAIAGPGDNGEPVLTLLMPGED